VVAAKKKEKETYEKSTTPKLAGNPPPRYQHVVSEYGSRR